MKLGGWYLTRTPDGEIWAESSDPTAPYLAHPDPTVELTWWRLDYDEQARRLGETMAYQPWSNHPTDLVHPSVGPGARWEFVNQPTKPPYGTPERAAYDAGHPPKEHQ